jgi:5-methylcytosine-specific restriction endonuclease McrA
MCIIVPKEKRKRKRKRKKKGRKQKNRNNANITCNRCNKRFGREGTGVFVEKVKRKKITLYVEEWVHESADPSRSAAAAAAAAR